MLKISVIIFVCAFLSFSVQSVMTQTDPKAALSPYAIVYAQSFAIDGIMHGSGSFHFNG